MIGGAKFLRIRNNRWRNMKKLLFLVWSAVMVVAVSHLLTPNTLAQSVVSGALSGTVTDATGAILTNSTVAVKSLSTGETQTAATGSAGEFRFPLLRPGAYTLTVGAPGFQESNQKITINLGQVATVNVQLGIQAQTQSVNVNESATLIQSDNANLATTFNLSQLENLPAPGNDMTAYAFTTPGVTISTGGGYGNFSVFGLPGVSNLFTINGTDNMDPYLNLNNSGASNLTLGSNEIAEAAVVVNGYTGQYGRQAGANVNYVTKSGTNAFHGNAAWYYNGRVMNANDWFNNATGTERPFSISNEWADSVGGPIIKNKLFFFFDNEGLRYVLPGGGAVYVPTSDFSSYVLNNIKSTNAPAAPFYTTALNLFAGSSGAGRATPVTASFDPQLGCGDFAAAGFGTTKPCASTFRSAVNNLNTEWLLATKVDYNLTNTDRIFFRYNMDRGVQATGTDPINPAFNANSVQPSYGGQFGYTKVIGATMVNQLNLSATDYSAIFGPPNLSAALGVFPTTFTFGDGLYSNLGGSDNAYPQGRKVRQWQLLDDFSITHNSHTIKFGANVRANWVSTYAYGANTSGLFTFNSITDFVNGSLDNGSTYSQSFARIGAQGLSLYSAGFYGQDEWKIRPNLTATLTLRLDRNSNIHCAAGCFNELIGQPFGQVSHNVTTPYNSSIQTGLKAAFPSVEPFVPEPRIGIAYNLRQSTVLRGGFGIFSDLYQGLIADRFITNSPNVASFTTSSGLVAQNNPNSAFAAVSNSFKALQSGFANGATLAQLKALVPLGFSTPNFNTIANRLYNPKYYEWNFEVQQALGKQYLFSVNYVGNKGYQELNQTVFANAYSAKGFASLPTSAPDPRFGEIRQLNNNGFSNYNGLVSSVKWRLGSQLSGQFSYTWSHALDTCSNSCLEPFNALTAVSLRYQINPANLRSLNYSNADYDVRHSLNANYVYSVPSSYLHNSILKGALGGWTAAGTVFFHSGYPFSIVNSGVRSGQVTNASGIATQQFIADYLGGSSYPSCSTPNISCYTASQFSKASSQHDFGNIPRNSFRGPGYFNTDLTINKVFAIRERYQLLVGGNFFNVLNHPNFDLPGNNVALGSFGSIQSTVSAPTSAYGSFQGSAVSGRVIQTQVKFTF